MVWSNTSYQSQAVLEKCKYNAKDREIKTSINEIIDESEDENENEGRDTIKQKMKVDK